MDNNLKM